MPPQDLWYPQFTLGSWLSPLHNVPCITTIRVIFFVLASDHWYIIHNHWPWPFHLSWVSLSFHKIYDVLVEILLGYSENLSRRVNSTRLFKIISSITYSSSIICENHATLLLSPLVVCRARDRLLHSISYFSFPILFSSTSHLCWRTLPSMSSPPQDLLIQLLIKPSYWLCPHPPSRASTFIRIPRIDGLNSDSFYLFVELPFHKNQKVLRPTLLSHSHTPKP